MQAHEDFIFHLDEPRDQFRFGRKRLRGWIAARAEVTQLRVGNREVQLEERPDVRRAFPNFAYSTGFLDEVDADELRSGALEFSFRAADQTRSVLEPLRARPRLPLVRRVALHLRKCRPQRNWNAKLDALLAEIELQRGDDFRREEADRLIALFAAHYPNASVVQIGAAEGLLGDPLVDALSKTRWRALLVEPVPELCAALRARYRDKPEVRIAQAAVADRDGEMPLYRLRTTPGETPEWFNHLATLNREVLLQHRGAIPEVESLIIEERVPTARFETLLARYDIDAIDLFVIDTEGHDFEILRDFDFGRFQPIVLMFEHQHLSASDKTAAFALLKANGYTFREMPEGDAIAWRKL